MSKRVQDNLWRGVLFILILLPAMQPLLQSDALPCTHDSAFHYYRITTLKAGLQQGLLFSRWVPGLALGFGYPFFNYREPLPYWAGEALLVAGLPAPLALGLLYVLSMLAAAWGMFTLARDLFGEKAGWVSAVLYALAPYMLLDVLRRGNMPEVWAFALLPWIFVAFRNLILGKGPRWFVLATVLLSALFLSHNISSLLLAPFLGAYVLLLSVLYRERKAWPWAFAAVGLALLLTAWFWMPALLEQDYVQLHLSTSTRNNDFHYNFVSWMEILGFGSYAPYDPDYLNPPMRITLGVVQWVFALPGLAFGLWRLRDKEQRWTLALLAVFGLGYLALSTEGTVRFWETFDLLSFVQFPWRLVGRALLPASLLAGALVSDAHGASNRKGYAVWLGLGIVVIAMVMAYPQTFPPKGMCAAKPYPTLADVHAYERQGWLGMDPESSYFPVWVEDHQIVATRPELAEALQAGREPARWDTDAMPEGAQVLSAVYRPLRATLEITTPETFTARWWGLYFPGWQVRIDGEQIEVMPEKVTGLITFDVPAGAHTIKLRFGETPLRRWADLLSLLGVAGLAGVVWWQRKRPLAQARTADVIGDSPSDDTPTDAGLDVHMVLFGALVIWMLVQNLLLPNISTFLQARRLQLQPLPEGVVARSILYNNGMQVLGYALQDQTLTGSTETRVDVLWTTMQGVPGEYRTTVLLMDDEGRQWSAAGTARPRGYEPAPPTTMWQAGQYAYDPHLISALPGTPPGEYRVVLSLFDRYSLNPATVLDADRMPVGSTLDLGSVTVLAPAEPASLLSLGVAEEAALTPCGALGLWSVTLDREQAAPGDIVALRWVWEAVDVPSGDVLADVTLYKPDGGIDETWMLEPAAPWFPTGQWQAGDRWASSHILRLPGGLESGVHRFDVSLPGCASALKSASLQVNAPERVYELPAGIQSLSDEVVFGGDIKLVAHNILLDTLQRGSKPIVQLAWQAAREMTTSYRIYLHLLAPDGTIAAQNDSEPAGWTRPTTGWLPGEYIVEDRGINIPANAPAGDYILRVGVYDMESVRLLTADGDDGYTLMIFEVR